MTAIDRRRSVGWYGRPGLASSATKVHLHDCEKHGPACGVRLHRDAEYQWCSWDHVEWIECRRCRRIAARLLGDQVKAIVVRARALGARGGGHV